MSLSMSLDFWGPACSPEWDSVHERLAFIPMNKHTLVLHSSPTNWTAIKFYTFPFSWSPHAKMEIFSLKCFINDISFIQWKSKLSYVHSFSLKSQNSPHLKTKQNSKRLKKKAYTEKRICTNPRSIRPSQNCVGVVSGGKPMTHTGRAALNWGSVGYWFKKQQHLSKGKVILLKVTEDHSRNRNPSLL